MADLSICAPWLLPAAMRPSAGCTPCGAIEAATPSDAVIATAILDASQYLHAVSGWKFPGECVPDDELAARPCGGDTTDWCIDPFRGIPPEAYVTGSCLGCGGDSCCGPTGVTLGYSPVISVEEVRVDGDPLLDSEWELVGDVLVRLSGSWPHCQDRSLPDTEEGTFAVDFTWGVAPPSLGVSAAKDLACVLVKSRCGDSSCQPVAGEVESKTAGGVTTRIRPVGEILEAMPRSVRMFVEAYAPGGYRQGPKMRRPAVGGLVTSSADRGPRWP